MSDQFQRDSTHSHQILAKDAQVGKAYRSRTDLPVILREKGNDRVVVRSLVTGHDIAVPQDYPLWLVEEDR